MNTNGVLTIETGPSNGPPTQVLVVPANPDQQQTTDWRYTATQTLGGFFVDAFGPGLQYLTLSGNTAFDAPQGRYNGVHIDGDTAAKRLYQMLVTFANDDEAGKNVVCNIYDDAFGRSWQVKPMGQLQLSRSSSSPTTLNYQQQFLVLKDNITVVNQTKTPDPIKSIWQTSTSVRSKAKQGATSGAARATSVRQTKDSIYYVKSGDTLWAIAQNYLPAQHTVQQTDNMIRGIVLANGLRDPNRIFVGERLAIPPA